VIERYSRPEMTRIWEPENRYRKWLEIEIYACEAHAEMGRIPQEAVERIRAKASFDVERIDEIERTVKHDVIAFLTWLAEAIGEDSRFVHLGMTSSSRTHFLIGGFTLNAAHIANRGCNNSCHIPEPAFCAPKTSRRKICSLDSRPSR